MRRQLHQRLPPLFCRERMRYMEIGIAEATRKFLGLKPLPALARLGHPCGAQAQQGQGPEVRPSQR